jgi:hypothetical protein
MLALAIVGMKMNSRKLGREFNDEIEGLDYTGTNV